MPRRFTKQEWARLKQAFINGSSLGQISRQTGISRGTLSARCAREKWVRWRPEVLLQQLLVNR